jgi:hypothetical protein
MPTLQIQYVYLNIHIEAGVFLLGRFTAQMAINVCPVSLGINGAFGCLANLKLFLNNPLAPIKAMGLLLVIIYVQQNLFSQEESSYDRSD